jgi:hypothetical protein
MFRPPVPIQHDFPIQAAKRGAIEFFDLQALQTNGFS